MSADSYKYDPVKPYPYDDVNLCPCAECGRVRAGEHTTHACPTCGDVHLPPGKNTTDELRAAGWSDDYIERHAGEIDQWTDRGWVHGRP